MNEKFGWSGPISNHFQNSFICKWRNEKLGSIGPNNKQSNWNILMGKVYSIAGKGFKISWIGALQHFTGSVFTEVSDSTGMLFFRGLVDQRENHKDWTP